MIINNKFEEPYDKFPKQDEHLPLLSKYTVKSRLSDKFFKYSKFLTNFEKNLEQVNIQKVRDRYTITSEDCRIKLINNKKILKQSKLTFKRIELLNRTSNAYNTIKLKKRPYDILNKDISELMRSYELFFNKKNNFIDSYDYERDIYKLKKLMDKLEADIKVIDL